MHNEILNHEILAGLCTAELQCNNTMHIRTYAYFYVNSNINVTMLISMKLHL